MNEASLILPTLAYKNVKLVFLSTVLTSLKEVHMLNGLNFISVIH